MCQLHRQAFELYQQGVNLVSTDEMTGIQALERAHNTLPMKPGQVELQEFEYIRHQKSAGSPFFLGMGGIAVRRRELFVISYWLFVFYCYVTKKYKQQTTNDKQHEIPRPLGGG